VQPPPAPKPRRRLLAWLVGGATLALLVVAAIVLWPRPAAEVTDAHIYGFEHSCVVTASGGVRCWGMNTYGELGDGTTTDRSTPVEVTGLRSPVASVATNAAHSCAVTTSGTVVCWGRNTDGQLGDGRRAASTTPVAVSGLGDVTAITTGVYHTCALTAGGTVWCWGDNNAGALGTDGEPSADEATPARVGGTGDRFVAVSAGTSHTCAATAAGAVTCWGLNDGGQLGNGDTEASGVPVAVVGLDSGVTSLTAGSHHTCALLSSSAVRCWGLNTHGELGDGTRVGTLVPASIVGLDGDATALSGGGLHTCATLADHSTWCWGRNSEGQLGNGTTTDSATPTRVVGLP
jgi:alpha-tubulin suppressor-like RCC1 family protein